MTACLGKSCSFGLLCVSFVGVCKILCVCPSFPFGIDGRMWDVIVLIPGRCLSIYYDCLVWLSVLLVIAVSLYYL